MPLNKARFMEFLSPNGNFQATDLHPVDQAATEIIVKRKDEDLRCQTDSEACMNMGGPEEWKERAREQSVLNRRMKRLYRGGSTVRPGDGLCGY